jgi:hypothetical protein
MDGLDPDPATWPTTLDEVVDRLLSRMSEADKELVRNTPEDDLIRFHLGWGMGIRHEFGLWRGNGKLLVSCADLHPDASMVIPHPDDASLVIIRAVWERLRGAAI